MFDRRNYLLCGYLPFTGIPDGERVNKIEVTMPMQIPPHIAALAKKHGLMDGDTIVTPPPDHPFWDELEAH